MSTVFMMKFNDEQGAMIADESTWHLSFKYGYRRANYGDHVMPLLDAAGIQRHGIAAVYGGVGFPSLHFEVVENAQAALREDTDLVGSSLEQLSEVVFARYQQAHRRMIDDRLRFLFGINCNELNALSFNRNGRDFQINQETVIEDAKKILHYQEKSDPMIRIFENTAAVMGYSEREGIQAYYLSSDHKGLDFAYALAVLGEGNQVASHIFGKIATTMDLPERRRGFSLVDGLAILLDVAANTARFQGKMGGYFQLALIDGRAPTTAQKILEISDHRLKLATEIAMAHSWKLLSRPVALELIEGLILRDMPFDDAEQQLFSKASDSNMLRLGLMGYKLKTEYNDILNAFPDSKPATEQEKKGV